MIDVGALAPGLVQGTDGIWYAAAAQPVSYPADGNQLCFAIEDGSFWFRHRNACIVELVRAFPPPGGGAVFDIGGGNGFVSAGLARAGFEVALVEPGPRGAANALRRGVGTVICATLDTAGFRPAALPAVGLFDVIEHVPDDARFLATVRDSLQPGGRLYIAVPAGQWLWSGEDVAAGHHRRYSLRGLEVAVGRAGFQVEFASYFFRLLTLPIAVFRALPWRLGLRRAGADPGRDHAVEGGLVASAFERLCAPEIRRIGRCRPMRVAGASCLLVARRR